MGPLKFSLFNLFRREETAKSPETKAEAYLYLGDSHFADQLTLIHPVDGSEKFFPSSNRSFSRISSSSRLSEKMSQTLKKMFDCLFSWIAPLRRSSSEEYF